MSPLDIIFLGWYHVLAKTIYRHPVPGDYIGPAEHAFFISYLLHGLNTWTLISIVAAYYFDSNTTLEVGLINGVIVFLLGYAFFLKTRAARMISRTYSSGSIIAFIVVAIVYAVATVYAMTKTTDYILNNVTLK